METTTVTRSSHIFALDIGELPCAWPGCTFSTFVVDEIINHFTNEHGADEEDFIQTRAELNKTTDVEVFNPSNRESISSYDFLLTYYKEEAETYHEYNHKDWELTRDTTRVEQLEAENANLRKALSRFEEENRYLRRIQEQQALILKQINTVSRRQKRKGFVLEEDLPLCDYIMQAIWPQAESDMTIIVADEMDKKLESGWRNTFGLALAGVVTVDQLPPRDGDLRVTETEGPIGNEILDERPEAPFGSPDPHISHMHRFQNLPQFTFTSAPDDISCPEK